MATQAVQAVRGAAVRFGVRCATGGSWAAAWGNGDDGRLGHGKGVGSVPRPARVLLHDAVLSGDLTGGVGNDEVDENVVAVSAGGAHSAILTGGGVMLTAGLNDNGQLGRESFSSFCSVYRKVTLPEPVIQVASGSYHTLALLKSGKVAAFGGNQYGQLGNEEGGKGMAVSMAKLPPIRCVVAGKEHSVAISDEGEVYTWGNNRDGRCGQPLPKGWLGWIQDDQIREPKRVDSLKGCNIVTAAAGDMHTVVVDEEGKCYTFGEGRFGQLGIPSSYGHSSTPIQLKFDHPIVSVAAGGLHTGAVSKFGALHMWGGNENGALGSEALSAGHQVEQPVQVQIEDGDAKVVQLACGWKHSAAVTEEGRLFTWGWGGSVGSVRMGGDCGGGQLGHGNENDTWHPRQIQGILTIGQKGTEVRTLSVSCGFNHSLAVMQNVRINS